jgi:hypothetical protein
MSRKNSNSNANKSQGKSTSEAAPSPTSTVRRRASVGTVAERLVSKVTNAFKLVEDALQLGEARGVSDEILAATRAVAVAAHDCREKLLDLRDSGWQPVSTSSKEIVEGDHVAVAREHGSTYSYIPGVGDGTAALVAGKVVPTGNRSARVLVVGEAGGVYGYVPRNHLVRR